MYLAVERTHVEPVLILRVDRNDADITPARADDLPVGESRSLGRYVRHLKRKCRLSNSQNNYEGKGFIELDHKLWGFERNTNGAAM